MDVFNVIVQKRIKDIQNQDLLAQLKLDPQSGFKLIFNTYWIELFQIAVRKLGSEEDANDIVQDVFISFWQIIPTLDNDTSFKAYLTTSLRNKILNFYERNSVRLKYNLSLLESQRRIDYHSNPGNQLQAKELEELYEKAILNLPKKMQEIYRMSRILHFSNSEIAEKLNVSIQTVKNQLSTADSRIRKTLSSYNQTLILFIHLGLLLG